MPCYWLRTDYHLEEMSLQVVIYPDEDGYIVAECPALPGCVSQGLTRAEALTNIREAIDGWLEVEASSSGR